MEREVKFNILRGIVMGAFLITETKEELIDFVNELEEYKEHEEQGLLVKINCRCRDCKHVDFAGCTDKTCYCYKNECYMNEDDFCKYAEKDNEEAEQKLAEIRGE